MNKHIIFIASLLVGIFFTSNSCTDLNEVILDETSATGLTDKLAADGNLAPVIAHANLHINEGELALVVGPTGSGKTTLLHAINGLVPHFSGGTLSGRVVVDGRDTATHPPRELADVVGEVQDLPLEI